MRTFFLRHAGRAVVLLGCSVTAVLAAQTQVLPSGPPKSSKAATTQAARKHGRKPKAAVPEPAPQAETPPPPPAPKWPATAKAEHASVAWDGRDLSVQASNSSLQQILHDVSTATGLKVEGLSGGSGEQRIYGNYGPAATRDVLTALLDGSGFNILMIGDSGQGTPRVLVLTSKAKSATPATTGVDNQQNQDNPPNDDEAPEEPEQPEPQPQPQLNAQPPFGGGPQTPGTRTPQEIMQEMQQRQLIMQQQQQQQLEQQQQQQQPPPQPDQNPQPEN